MNSHVTNQTNRDIIISSIHWNPVALSSGFKIGDWISSKATSHLALLTWIYRMAEVLPNLVKAIEFCRISLKGLIRAVNSQEVTLSPIGYHSVRILFQEKHIAPFRVVTYFSTLPKSVLYWIFETSFIDILPWDSGEWHWQATPLQGTRLSLVTHLNGDI